MDTKENWHFAGLVLILGLRYNSGKFHYSDIIHYQNKFYGIDFMERLIFIDIKSDEIVETRIVVLKDISFKGYLYLVEFKGKLLVVVRRKVNEETHSFKVFEINIDLSSSSYVWKEVVTERYL